MADEDALIDGLMGNTAMVRLASLVAAFYKELLTSGVAQEDAMFLTSSMLEMMATIQQSKPGEAKDAG